MSLVIFGAPEQGALSIHITDADTYLVERIDARGVAGVRHPDLADPDGPFPAGTELLDRECPLTGPVTYRSIGYLGDVVDQVTLTTALADPGTAVLTVPLRPQLVCWPLLVTGLDDTRQGQVAEHTVIGRADPITTTGVLATRRGPITLLLADAAAATSLVSVLDPGEVLMLRIAGRPASDRYMVITEASLRPSVETSAPGGEVIAATLEHIEVARPTGLVIESGWTYDDLVSDTSLPTYASLLGAYPTYLALLDGPAS